MRNFFSGGLKDNRHLSFAFMTGILRVAKESSFSGMNNLKLYSIMDSKFSDYFGFTEAEVEEMSVYYDCKDKITEIKEWYNGYLFGESGKFNRRKIRVNLY